MSPIVCSILTIGVVSLLVQTFYWNKSFQKLSNHYQKSLKKNPTPTSIIICFKNEADNFRNLAKGLISMDLHPESEVLLINDHSTDKSLEMGQKLLKNHPQVSWHVNQYPEYHKKGAVLTGIGKAKNKILLFSDADCHIPVDWEGIMNAHLQNGRQIVLGYGPYLKQNGFLNKWIRYEAVLTAIQYLSAALSGKAYMGVGRNLLIEKSLIEDEKIIKSHTDLRSGDDDLTVNALSNENNTAISIDRNAWVYSSPHTSFKKYINQKIRHYSTAHRYKVRDKLNLLTFSTSWMGVYFSLLALIVLGQWKISLILYFFRLLTTWKQISKLFSKLDYSDGTAIWPILDIITPLYFMFFSIFTLFPKKNKW